MDAKLQQLDEDYQTLERIKKNNDEKINRVMVSLKDRDVSHEGEYSHPVANALSDIISPTQLFIPLKEDLREVIKDPRSRCMPYKSSRRKIVYAEEVKRNLSLKSLVKVLLVGTPKNLDEYNQHLNKLIMVLLTFELQSKRKRLLRKLDSVLSDVDKYLYGTSYLYLVIHKNYDQLINLLHQNELTTAILSFLVKVFSNLNYWELYNLLQWNSSIYGFIRLINLDFEQLHEDFIANSERNRLQHSSKSGKQGKPGPNGSYYIPYYKRDLDSFFEIDGSSKIIRIDNDMEQTKRNSSDSADLAELDYASPSNSFEMSLPIQSATYPQKRGRSDSISLPTTSSHNYPQRAAPKIDNYASDTQHECQLIHPETGRLCLRRFSRKYELIRHQETVHSPTKKIYRCMLCKRENLVPRVFTRHDTLAKHIRVNHKVTVDEAKQAVAYAKEKVEVINSGAQIDEGSDHGGIETPEFQGDTLDDSS